MLRIFQYCYRALSLSKNSIIHQVAKGQRLLNTLCLQPHCVRETPLVLANSSIRFFSLTPPKKDLLATSFILSQLSAAAQWAWSTNPSIQVLSPEVGHPVIERSEEIKKVEEALKKQNKQVTVVYLAGEPGIGKSQLARKYGEIYYNSYFPRPKTALMLDMREFRANYSKLAINIGVQPDVANAWSEPRKIAQEVKKALSSRTSWLLILDNYNCLTYEGFDRVLLEKELLPLHGSNDWGSGTVLITTNNAGVIPSHARTTGEFKVTVSPLSVDESTMLIEQITNYKFSDMEKKLLATTARKRHWRYLPLVMANIGDSITLRRKQQTEYNFIDFVKELERREAKDPEEARYKIKSALENMMKTSDALYKTFRLLAMCPQNVRIPWKIFERLMKKHYLEEWASKLDEIYNCTVLNVEHDSNNHLRFLNTHRQYLWAMQDIMKYPLKGTYSTEDEHVMTTFIDCIVEEYDYYRSAIINEFTSQTLDSLFQLLKELESSIKGSKKFGEEVKMKIESVRDQYLNTHKITYSMHDHLFWNMD